MSWFWKSKSAGTTTQQSSLQECQALVERLRLENDSFLKRHEDFEASLKTAVEERNTARSEADQMILNERQRGFETIAVLNRKIQEAESNLASERQKLALLDEANVSMAEMLRNREKQIEDLQNSIAAESQKYDKKNQMLELRLRDVESDAAASSANAAKQISDLTGQLQQANEQADVRIRELEQQLTESESRSANRAEQRSALLRNMAEIHRLSAVSSKVEISQNSLKIPLNSLDEQKPHSAECININSTTSDQVYPSWGDYKKSESA